MKTSSKIITEYECEICGAIYSTKKEALKCESKPVTYDRGVKIGDTVRIIRGDGQGLAKVENIWIIDKDWGHYVADRYHHTVAMSVKCLDSWGNRTLTFDDYELI